MRRGSRLKNTAYTATNSAPTLVTQGFACAYSTIGGDENNADEITAILKFAGSCTTATITPYIWVGSDAAGAWVSGALYSMKKVGDSDGGAILDLPMPAAARRLYYHVSALDHADGFSIETWHNEHHEGL